ncbi:hypothetical protein Gotri_007601 [Gossypium trilobum]|uniref:Uncharacterized protein n=1 Tax=Gossypium trilobum TaxID=34281 RepID=A0A7J9EGJ6_9ROSI|nr:hypothetical protein [Gossypium trilobum]
MGKSLLGVYDNQLDPFYGLVLKSVDLVFAVQICATCDISLKDASSLGQHGVEIQYRALVIDKKCSNNALFSIQENVQVGYVGVTGAYFDAASFDVISSHFNLTFEGVIEMGVTMKEGVLDPARHTTIVFKENKDPNLTGVVEGGCSKLSGNEAIHLSRFRVDGRALGNRKGMRLKKTIQDWGNIFKNLGNSQVPLAGLVNTVVYLISIQLELDTNKEEAIDDVVVSGAMKVYRQFNVAKAIAVISNLGFLFSYRLEVIGFFGGYMDWAEGFASGASCQEPSSVYFDSFQVPWVVIGNFNALLSDSDKKGGSFKDTLSCLSMEVKKWNRVVYRHISTRKRHIVNRLADIQKVIERPDELGFSRELGNLGFFRGPSELVFASWPSKLRLPMGLASCNHWFGPSELRFC